jgi:hypothetical protein
MDEHCIRVSSHERACAYVVSAPVIEKVKYSLDEKAIASYGHVSVRYNALALREMNPVSI